MPALDVNSKSNISPVHPRVKETVAASWGGGGGITDEGQGSGDQGGSHSTEEVSTGLEEKARCQCLKGEKTAEHKEGEKLVTIWFI